MDADKERGSIVQKKWSNNLLFLVSCTSLHTLVNKYVLSVLKFQYPTLFISWQCAVCVVLMMMAHYFGFVKLSIIDRSVLKIWLPCMFLHTAVMYFGSVSLSKLAIPVFIGFQNLMYLCVEAVNFWKSKVIPSLVVQISLLLIGLSSARLFYTNFTINPVAYKWVSAYILCSGLYSILFEVMKDTKISGLVFLTAKHIYEVSTNFMKAKERKKRLNTAKWSLFMLLVPVFLLTVRSPVRGTSMKNSIIFCIQQDFLQFVFLVRLAEHILLLTLFGILTREWQEFFEFPFRYDGKFIAGCWFSGIFYFLSLIPAYILTKETSSQVIELGVTSNRLLVSILSLGIFETTLDASSAFSILLLLVGGIAYASFKFNEMPSEN